MRYLRYISAVSNQDNTGWAYRLLGLLIGQVNYSMSEDDCTHLPYYWYAGYNTSGECHLTTQNMSLAYSPAFLMPGTNISMYKNISINMFPFINYNKINKCIIFFLLDYDWKSGKYSTWTESTWSEMNARIFLKPSTSHESLTFAIGFVVMIISFVFVFLINSRSDVLFDDCLTTSNT